MSITQQEAETCINYNNAENTALLYSASTRVIRKMDALSAKRPDLIICTKRIDDPPAAFYEIPKSCVSIRLPRQMSDEQKAALSKRMREARAKS